MSVERAGSSRRRVEGIDLLRGIAVLLVMLRHAFPTPFAGAGVVGIVMFFTLSGYLITGVLIDELTNRSQIRLARFYRRRAVRLMPALVVLLACFAVVTIVWDPLGDRGELPRTLLVGLTYTADLPFEHGSDGTFHLWTLAMEEQFYLIWPALLAFAWVRGKVGAALLGVGLASLLSCVTTLIWLSPDVDLAYTLPTSWSVCFAIGAALRYVQVRTPGLGAMLEQRQAVAVGASVAALAVLSVIPLRGHSLTYLLGGPAIAILTGILLVCWHSWFVVHTSWLRALVTLGTVSYAAYLWNYPLTLWLKEWSPVTGGVLAMPLTVVAAALSWRYVEQRFSRKASHETALA